ncbi:MAG: methyltransferase [Marmoricola sp.]
MTADTTKARVTAAPHEQIWAMTNAAVSARCLQIAADLGVADHIEEQPVPVDRLAAACGADADGLDRILGLLAAHGVFDETQGAYSHTPSSRVLRSDHPMSMRAFAQMMGLQIFQDTFAHLGDAVRGGGTAVEQVSPGGLWPYLEQHPREQEIFGRAMTAKAAGDAGAILAAYDFGRFADIADIGGGRGHLVQAILESAPASRGVLFDLPEVTDGGGAQHPRLSRQSGDFFVDALPQADCYLLMEVIHDWADAEATRILSAIRRAAKPDARVLIIENVLSEARPDPRGRILDVIMLAVTGGRERTPSQLAVLLESAGLALADVIDTGGPLRIVEATVRAGA